MESINHSGDTPTPVSPVANTTIASPRPVRTPWVLIIAVSLVSGIVGGLASRGGAVPAWLTAPGMREAAQDTAKNKSAPILVAAEDQKIVGMVSANTKAVVSIVITKDVPRFRNIFRSPFGMNFPFFGGIEEPTAPRDNATERKQVGSGSGFLISQDGYVVTNKHVVADKEAEYTVILSDEKEYPAKVLALAPNNDIAVLKIEGNDFPALTLGDSDQVQVGQTVIAIGNPLGEFANSVSRGIVSGLGRSVTAGSALGETETLQNIIQTDAAINPGNSGGPLLDIEGRVVGINVAVAQGAENIGFALPVNSIKRVVEEVKTTGKLSIPYLGVRYMLLDKTVAASYDLPIDKGALVLRGERMSDLAVIPGSPADKAGIVENDIILEVDGIAIGTDMSLSQALAEKRVGDTVKLKVWHKGDTKEVSVLLEERKSS